MTKVVFTFIICLGVYFVLLGIWSIVKRVLAKRKYQKDKKKAEEEAKKEEESNNEEE